MKAMILAAGRGTRLQPLTKTTPKALVRLSDKPLLDYVLQKLKDTRVQEVVINLHHFADQIKTYIEKKPISGLKISFSYEKELLDTGGGLKKASWFFNDKQPFILHNVDVLSEIDLTEMLKFHLDQTADVTLAVKDRKTSRYFLFDKHRGLAGWESVKDKKVEMVRNTGEDLKRLSFLGIHILSPRIFSYFPEADEFSIIPFYLDLARQQRRILAYDCPDEFWLDVGKKENLKAAQEWLTVRGNS